ncbi:MAG: hypothetical protein HOP31_15125 [Ignavibacteria bacterium]|nr:hypothetical protein [Ignavibacteria bacterium]
MEINCEFILYVSDQKKSRDFYSFILDKEPSLDVEGMTEFLLSGECKLGLMPAKGIMKILGKNFPEPETIKGVHRCELYLEVPNIEESYSRAVEAGATELSPVTLRNWGHRVGYLSDPDGHIIAFASI